MIHPLKVANAPNMPNTAPNRARNRIPMGQTVFGRVPNKENGIGKPKADEREEVFGAFGVFGSSKDDPGMDF